MSSWVASSWVLVFMQSPSSRGGPVEIQPSSTSRELASSLEVTHYQYNGVAYIVERPVAAEEQPAR